MSFVATHSTFDAVTMAIQTLVGPEQQASLDRALWLEPRSLSDLRLRRLLRETVVPPFKLAGQPLRSGRDTLAKYLCVGAMVFVEPEEPGVTWGRSADDRLRVRFGEATREGEAQRTLRVVLKDEREIRVGRYQRPKWTGQAVLSARWSKARFEIIKFTYGTWMNVLVSGSYVLETSPS